MHVPPDKHQGQDLVRAPFRGTPYPHGVTPVRVGQYAPERDRTARPVFQRMRKSSASDQFST